MAEDDVLGIQATINGDEIQKGATDFINKINEMERAADRASNSMADGFQFLDQQIHQLSSSLEANRQKLESIFSQMQSFKPTNSISTEAYTKLQDEYARAMSMQQKLEEQLSKATSEINTQRQAYERLTAEIRENGKESVSASMPQLDSSISNIKELKEQFKQLGIEIKNNEKLYEQQAQKLSEYEAKIARYQEAQAKGVTRIGIGGAKSELVEPALQKTTQEYEELRQKQIAITSEIDKQRQRQQELNAQMEQANPKVVRFRTELMNVKQQMMEMIQAGRQNTKEFDALQKKASELQWSMVQANKQVSTLAMPGTGLQATREGVTALTGAFTTGMGIMGLFNAESEELAKMQTRLQSVMAITMGVQQLMSVTYATSALRIYALGKAKLFLTTITNGLRTAFVGMGLSATGASIAVTALYAALTLGISAAITAIVTAISAWVSKNKELSKTQEEQKQKLEEEQKLRKNAASSVTSLLSEYKRLQSEYKSMNGSLDKQKKFIRDNQTEFQKLGVSIKDVNDAENLFVSKEQEFIDSLKNRALAAAAMAQMQEQYKTIINKMVEKDDYVQNLGDNGTLKAAQSAAIADIKKMLVKKGIVKTEENAQAYIPEILAAYKEKRANKNIQLKDSGIQEEYSRIYNKYAKDFSAMEGIQLFDNSKEVQDAEKKIKQLIGVAQQKTEQADKVLENAGIDKYGKGDKKEETEAEKLRKEQEKYKILLSKQELERVRAEEDLQMKVDEANIKAMDEGSKKTIAQMELNFEKEMQAIDRQKEDALRKKIEDARATWDANPENKGKSFDATGIELSADENKYYDALYKAAILNNEKVYSNLADKYQSYTDQRLAIEKKFNDDISVLQEARKKAESNGNTDEVAKIDRSITKAIVDKGKGLMKHDFDVLKQSPEYIRAFEDLKNTSSETLASLLEQLEEAKETAATVLNPEDLREYTTTIQEIMDELDSRNPFQTLADRQKELAEAEQELAKAKKQLDAIKDGAKIVTGVKSTSLGEDGKIKIENTYLTAAEALDIYNAAKDKAQKANNNFIKAEKTAREKVDELADAIKGIGNAIGGQAGEIISLMGDVALFATGTIDGISKVAQTGANAISAVEKASVILGIISTAIQLLQKISELGSNKAFNQYEAYAEKIKEINALTDTVNEYRIAALEAQQAEANWFSADNLRNLRNYKALHDEVYKAYVDKATESQAVYQNQSGGGWLTGAVNWIMGSLSPMALIGDKWKNIWGQGGYDKGQTAAIDNLRIETRKKSSGFLGTGIGGKSQKTEDLQTWINNNKDAFTKLGVTDFELFDSKGLINKELTEAVLNNFGNKLVGQTKETLEALIELREQYDEYIEQLHEYVSSLYEPLVDNFVDSLWDWLDNGKDALDSFKGYASDTFRDIVSDMMKTIVLDKVVDGFDDDVAELYEKYASGKLSEDELMKQVAERTGSLVDNYERNIPALENILSTVNGYFKDAGIDLAQPDDSTREASKKGIATASQDSVDENNGRLAVMQEHTFSIKEGVQQMNIHLGIIAGNSAHLPKLSDISSDIKTMVDLQQTSNTHLFNIANNTANLIGMREDMHSMKQDINTMLIKGMKLNRN